MSPGPAAPATPKRKNTTSQPPPASPKPPATPPHQTHTPPPPPPPPAGAQPNPPPTHPAPPKAVEAVKANGGTATRPPGRNAVVNVSYAFVTDPDGNQIELVMEAK